MGKTEYTRLLQQHQDRIYSLALYNLRDADDASDVTQETFLRLWRHKGELTENQVKAWLLRVCHNLCINHVRRRKTVRTYFGTPDSEAVDRLEASPDPETDPEARLESRQRRQTLLDSMAVLPAETRSIMMLHYYQDLKIHEIAGLLGLKTGTIKVRLHRARQALRQVLTQEQGGLAACKRETG